LCGLSVSAMRVSEALTFSLSVYIASCLCLRLCSYIDLSLFSSLDFINIQSFLLL
jgi:hypothetical protein